MKRKLVISRSSYLVCTPVLLALFVMGLLSAVWGWSLASGFLLFGCILCAIARLWANGAIGNLQAEAETSTRGIFPGEALKLKIRVRNQKLLPVLWMELFFPLDERLCLRPECTRLPEEWEKPTLLDQQASCELVGSKKLSGLLWHESRETEIIWSGTRRGIYDPKYWRLRTGDGFGLCQMEMPLDGMGAVAVFPALQDVDVAPFLKNRWNSQVGPKGVMEDLTVIRSTRSYTPSDPAKRINWRLMARGLPMQVNVYEDTLPRGVHFILDGESYSGAEKHLAELEDTLSILASLAVALEEQQAPCGISMPLGARNSADSISAGHGLEMVLWAMASYDPQPDQKDKDGHLIPLRSTFSEEKLLPVRQDGGRCYYVCYDMERPSPVFRRLEASDTTILSWTEISGFGDFECICLRNLKLGGGQV